MPRGQLPSAWHLRRIFASFQRQRAPADPPNSTFRAYTPLRWFMTSHEEFESECEVPGK